MKARVLVLVVCISLAAAGALAHDGVEHVMGTVTKVANNSITVKTTAKDPVTVGVVPATKFMMGKMAMKIDGLKVGDRVVIDATEPTEGTLVADTVQFSTPKAKAAPAATSHAAAAAKTTKGATSQQH
jgi:ribosomal protein S1